MPIPLCLSVPAVPDPFALPLPGGVEIEDVNVMRVLQPALTPLMPMFEIVDTIVALYNCGSSGETVGAPAARLGC
jgi:hypothetical protein